MAGCRTPQHNFKDQLKLSPIQVGMTLATWQIVVRDHGVWREPFIGAEPSEVDWQRREDKRQEAWRA